MLGVEVPRRRRRVLLVGLGLDLGCGPCVDGRIDDGLALALVVLDALEPRREVGGSGERCGGRWAGRAGGRGGGRRSEEALCVALELLCELGALALDAAEGGDLLWGEALVGAALVLGDAVVDAAAPRGL